MSARLSFPTTAGAALVGTLSKRARALAKATCIATTTSSRGTTAEVSRSSFACSSATSRRRFSSSGLLRRPLARASAPARMT